MSSAIQHTQRVRKWERALSPEAQAQKALEDEESNIRHAAISEFMKAANEESLPIILYHTLWLCPMDMLRMFIVKFEEYHEEGKLFQLVTMSKTASRMVTAWMPKSRRRGSDSGVVSGSDSPTSEQASSPSSSGSSVLSTSTSDLEDPFLASILKDVSERDGSKSSITNTGHVQQAYIYPPFLIHDEERYPHPRFALFKGLKIFWGGTTVVEDILSVIRDPEHPLQHHLPGKDTMQNYMTVGASERKSWNTGCWVLKPLELSTDKKTLTAEFWYITKTECSDDGLLGRQVHINTRPSMSRGDSKAEDGCCFFRITGEGLDDVEYLRSGDIITFTTSDPDKLPLPSITLLKLHWNLQCIVGMTTGIKELRYYDEEC